jgi:hypothetical protein
MDYYKASEWRALLTYKDGVWIVTCENQPEVYGMNENPFVAVEEFYTNLEELEDISE